MCETVSVHTTCVLMCESIYGCVCVYEHVRVCADECVSADESTRVCVDGIVRECIDGSVILC